MVRSHRVDALTVRLAADPRTDGRRAKRRPKRSNSARYRAELLRFDGDLRWSSATAVERSPPFAVGRRSLRQAISARFSHQAVAATESAARTTGTIRPAAIDRSANGRSISVNLASTECG